MYFSALERHAVSMQFVMSLAIALFLGSLSQNTVELATTRLPIGGSVRSACKGQRRFNVQAQSVLRWKRAVIYKLENAKGVELLFPLVLVYNEVPRRSATICHPHSGVSECCSRR